MIWYAMTWNFIISSVIYTWYVAWHGIYDTIYLVRSIMWYENISRRSSSSHGSSTGSDPLSVSMIKCTYTRKYILRGMYRIWKETMFGNDHHFILAFDFQLNSYIGDFLPSALLWTSCGHRCRPFSPPQYDVISYHTYNMIWYDMIWMISYTQYDVIWIYVRILHDLIYGELWNLRQWVNTCTGNF